MKTDYLLLPFKDSLKKTSLMSDAFYNVSPNVDFRIYTKYNELLPFIAPIKTANCTFNLKVNDWFGNIVANIPSISIKHRILKSGADKFIMFEGGLISCLDLGSCISPYHIEIEGFFSEWFWVSNSEDLIKFEFGNSQDFLLIPYSLGFKQYAYFDTTFGTSEILSYDISQKDDRGNLQVKYTKLTESFTFYFYNTPAYIKQLFSSIEGLDYLKVTGTEQSIFCLSRQGKIKSKRPDFTFDVFDLEVNILSDKVTELSYCEDGLFVDDSTCQEVINPAELSCTNNPIKDIKTDCNDPDPIRGITVNCGCVDVEIDFFATVTYQ